jgi:DNA primase
MSNSTLKPPSPVRRRFLRAAVDRYAKQVGAVEDYLGSRAINPDTAAKWKLGYVADPMEGHEQYRGRLAIPYLTSTGPVTMVFRCVQDHDCKAIRCPKYLAEDEVYRPIFNVFALEKPVPVIYVVEGELDAIVATSLGYLSVALPGATRWEEHWGYLWDGYERIVVLCDGDRDKEITRQDGTVQVINAGRSFGAKIKKELRYSNVTVLNFPGGHDTTSLIVEQGEQALHDMLKESR